MKRTCLIRNVAPFSALILMIGLLAGCYGQSDPAAHSSQHSAHPTETASPSPAPSAIAQKLSMESPSPSPVQTPGYESGKPHEESSVNEQQKKSNLVPIYTVAKGTVAITIDDGPTKYTKELLKVLRENDQTKVTFFFLGQNAATYPDSVTEAVYDGNEIGYHSNVHPKMTDMTFDQQLQEFNRGLSNLKKSDDQPVTLFRPPYGAYNNDTKVVTEDHHMKMVLWNEDPRDWSTTDASTVVKEVLSQVHSGSIIVMHDRPSTIKALPDIIRGIKKMGFKIVTI